MRRLILMRHAKTDLAAPGERDADRALTERGRGAAPEIGCYIAEHGLAPDQVRVSTARRARETWDFASPAIGGKPAMVLDKRLYEASPQQILAVLQETDDAAHTLMLVAHNPGLQRLAVLLVGSGDAAARQDIQEKFPTAALAVIDFALDRWSDIKPSAGRLDRFVAPRDL